MADTLTTEQVREQFGCTGIDDYEFNYTEYVENPKYLFQASRFDRWLAQYTAAKRAEWEAEGEPTDAQIELEVDASGILAALRAAGGGNR